MSIVRMTKQREIILEELKKLKTHPTASDLYDIVRKRLPKISLGTVYRNLEILAEMGLIKKLEVAGKEKRWDGDISKHYHFRCVKCGKVEDIFLKDEDLEKLDSFFKSYIDENVKFEDMNVEINGLCRDCNTTNN